MAKCPEIYPLLQAYLDATLSMAEEDALEKHLRACLRCRSRLVALARTANTLRDAPRAHATEDFTRRLFDRLGVERPEARPSLMARLKNMLGI